MTDVLAEELRRFAAHAAALFAAQPARRSVMLAIAQFWNDGADDELHSEIIASTRDTPIWPHECNELRVSNEYEGMRPVLAGEECWMCGQLQEGGYHLYGAYEDANVVAFELFCREDASQESEIADGFVPYAIARRRAHGVEVEVVGGPQRPPNTRIGVPDVPPEPWRDPTLRALYHEICIRPEDDSARAVLSDRLLELDPGDARGEAIALALRPDVATTPQHVVAFPSSADTRVPRAPTPAWAHDRLETLVREHLVSWIAPLGRVIPPGCAQLERGFLARAAVYIRDADDEHAVRDAAAWGTVEQLRFVTGSRDLIVPAMRALRDVGPIRIEGVEQLAAAAGPWAIERLHVVLDELAHRDITRRLAGVSTLSRLSHLILSGETSALSDAITACAGARWWPQLTRFTLGLGAFHDLMQFARRRPAHATMSLVLATDVHSPGGWELAFDPDGSVEITLAGWDGRATMKLLAELVTQLPGDGAVRLRTTPFRTFTEDDVHFVREHANREVTLC